MLSSGRRGFKRGVPRTLVCPAQRSSLGTSKSRTSTMYCKPSFPFDFSGCPPVMLFSSAPSSRCPLLLFFSSFFFPFIFSSQCSRLYPPLCLLSILRSKETICRGGAHPPPVRCWLCRSTLVSVCWLVKDSIHTYFTVSCFFVCFLSWRIYRYSGVKAYGLRPWCKFRRTADQEL